MRAEDNASDVLDPGLQGIDRMVRNVETGRFERSLSALTAAGSLVTAAEIYFEHDSASFGNKMMWLPVALGPVGAAAGVAGFFSRRMAKTALPLASAAIVANGLQGTYLHARGKCDNDKALMEAAQSVMEDILHCAGADQVITMGRYALLVGGARMAADEHHGVVDADCRSFAVPNLFIADGSVLPTQGSANPALTIMAVAARAADRLITGRLRVD